MNIGQLWKRYWYMTYYDICKYIWITRDNNQTIRSGFKDICINQPPNPSDVFDDVNTPISCINTVDIDDIEGSSSYSLKYIAKCATMPCENILPFVDLGEENVLTYTCLETRGHLASWFHLYHKQTHLPLWNLWPKNFSATWIPWSVTPPDS